MTSIDLEVVYNNGQTKVTDVFKNQSTGTFTGTVTAAPGYIITGVTGAYYKKRYIRTDLTGFTATKISDTQYSYSFPITDSNIRYIAQAGSTVYLEVNTAVAPAEQPKAEEPQAKEPDTIDLKVVYNNGLEDVTVDYPGQQAGNVTVTLTAAPGYIFTQIYKPSYKIGHITYPISKATITKISDNKYIVEFPLTEDTISDLRNANNTVRIPVETKQAPSNETANPVKEEPKSPTDNTNVTANPVKEEPKSPIDHTNASSSIVHTYVLSQNNYNELGRQIIDSIKTDGTGFEQYDYTKFVQFLYEIPFSVPTDITTNTSTINLGKKNLEINSRSVTHETLDIDLGSIDLTGLSNSNELNPVNITLFCPFSENINLPTTVVNSKLSLSFSINLKTEIGLLLIKQGENIVYTGQTELFTDLPLYYSAGSQDAIVRQLRSQYQNTIKQAYIVINYHKAITNLTSYKTNEHGTLANYKGFTRVSRGTLKKSINSTIDQNLLNLLRQGVIIK